jgi:hypothetical protein
MVDSHLIPQSVNQNPEVSLSGINNYFFRPWGEINDGTDDEKSSSRRHITHAFFFPGRVMSIPFVLFYEIPVMMCAE